MMSKYKRYYVAFPADDGPHGKTCGHQHATRGKAINCGGNAYLVVRESRAHNEIAVTFKKASA